MLNQTSVDRLAQVHPYLAYMVRKLDAALAARSIQIEVVQGLRSYNDQMALYAKGRTAPGPIVTSCQAGHSWHNFGLAVDVAPEGLAGTIDWNPQHPAWTAIYETAMEMGFTAGAKFRTRPDLPHLQITGKWPAEVPDDARQDFQDAGMGEIWRRSGLPMPPFTDETVEPKPLSLA